MKNETSEKLNENVDRRHMIEKAGLFLGAGGALAALAKPADAQNGNGAGGNAVGGATFLLTILDANGVFASRSVFTFHSDGSVEVIDSGQGGPAFLFSSQLGVWNNGIASGANALTLDFLFRTPA